MEGDSRSHRNCRHVYSLLADTAAITQPLYWLPHQLQQQPQHNHNGAITQPWHKLIKTTMMPLQCSPSALAARAFVVRLLQAYHTKQLMTKWVPHDQASSLRPSEYLVTRWVPREEVSTMWPSKHLVTQWVPHDQASTSWGSEYHVTKQVPRDPVSISLPSKYLMRKQVPCDQASILWLSEYLMTKQVPCDPVSTSWPSKYLVRKQVPRDQASTLWPSEYLVTKWVPHDVYVQCYKWSQLLHKHYLQNLGPEQEAMGQERQTTPSWLICSFPTLHPFRVSRLIISKQSIFHDISLASNTDPWIYTLQ